MSWVASSATVEGITGDTASERQRIRITVPESVKASMTVDTETYLFITYDSGSRVRVETGAYKIVDLTSKVVGTPPAMQTGGLFRASDDAATGDVVLVMVLVQPAPVTWRAMFVVMLGEHVSAKTVDYVEQVATPAPVDPAGGTPASVLFFGHESAPVIIDSNATPVARIDDDGSVVEAYTWSTAVVNGASGGPWFTTTITATVPTPPEPPYIRPPPVDADTFWAYPAPCEAADVFLINNDTLAMTWDRPPPDVYTLGDTLLLNHTDEEGTRWSLTEIEGWWTLPPPELPELPKSGYLDGSFPVDGRYNARQITVSGAFIPGPGVSVAVPRQRLLRALDAVRGGALFVAKEPVWAKQAWVYLMDQPKVTTKSVNQVTVFEFSLRAVDPIKYHAGVTGFQEVTLSESASNYLGRTYSTAQGAASISASFLWSTATAVAAPAAGGVSSTGAAFNDVTQTVCISTTPTLGPAVDFSVVKAGDPFVVSTGDDPITNQKLDGIVQSTVNHTTWWEILVGNNPSGTSTPAKPAAGATVSTVWRQPNGCYTDEATQRGMRFRPLGADGGDGDPCDLTLAPNPYRRYQASVEPSTVSLINAGTYPVSPRIYVYGPCSNPIVVNRTTGQRMQFLGDIMQGQVLVADCQWRMVTLRDASEGPSLDPRGDISGVNRRWMLDFTSQWITIVPGVNEFVMSASDMGYPARVVVAYRSGWLG